MIGGLNVSDYAPVMNDISIHRHGPNWNLEHKAWHYEFTVDHSDRSFSVPILISDDCPEDDRSYHANENFRAWAAKVAEEAAKL